MRNVLLITLCCFATAFSPLRAQVFGYINSVELLAGLDEVKVAEVNVEDFRVQQQKMLKMQVLKFQDELQALEKRYSSGSPTVQQLKKDQARLQAEKQRIAKMEADMEQVVAVRRVKKFQPIFDKVNTAIEQVAEARSCQYVFDAAEGGVVVYADEGMDITAAVKAVLAAR